MGNVGTWSVPLIAVQAEYGLRTVKSSSVLREVEIWVFI